jgi:polyisoprenoid-binding protein YceI
MPLAAAEQVLTLDPEATTVTFSLGATGHDIHGTMGLTAGELRFDAETGEASGSLTIDATLAVSGNRKRDKKMHRKVLETETYPEIAFAPSRIEGTVTMTGESDVTLVGVVAIHGDEHEVSLPTHVEMTEAGFTARATLTVPYVEWGMHDPSVMILRVAKVVEIVIEATGTRATNATVETSDR